MESIIIDVGTDKVIAERVVDIIKEGVPGAKVVNLDSLREEQYKGNPASIRITQDAEIVSGSTSYYKGVYRGMSCKRIPIIELAEYLKNIRPEVILPFTISGYQVEVVKGKSIKIGCATVYPGEIKKILEVYCPDAALQCP